MGCRPVQRQHFHCAGKKRKEVKSLSHGHVGVSDSWDGPSPWAICVAPGIAVERDQLAEGSFRGKCGTWKTPWERWRRGTSDEEWLAAHTSLRRIVTSEHLKGSLSIIHVTRVDRKPHQQFIYLQREPSLLQ